MMDLTHERAARGRGQLRARRRETVRKGVRREPGAGAGGRVTPGFLALLNPPLPAGNDVQAAVSTPCRPWNGRDSPL